jgi:signal transduction histidine kinase
MKKWRFFLNIFMVTAVLGVCFTASYLLSGFIFQFIPSINPFAKYLLTSLIGFFIFGLSVNLIRIISTKLSRNGWNRHNDELLEAISKISQGDFNVFIKENEHGINSDLVQGINEMAQKLGSMEKLRQDFISNVSHEIQSPLTSIGGFAALLKNESLDIKERRHYLDIIETECRRLSKLSDNLLKLSSLENNATPLTRQEYRLDKQLQSIILMLEPQWSEKNIKMDISLHKLSIEGDKDLLSQVWINLFHNAIKFTPKDGTISVELNIDDDIVSCTIADSGIGIAGEDQPHIFERFYKADKARDRSLGGNGLGLALVKKIVELHDGTVTVESVLNKGAKFTVKLPGLHSV